MSVAPLQITEPQSFFSRYLRWLDVLDPTALLSSEAEVENSRALLEKLGSASKYLTQDKKVNDAQKLCEASLHPDTGNAITTLFRPPAFMLCGTPLAIAALLPHTRTIPAFLSQFLFHTYNAGFTFYNRNVTCKPNKIQPFQPMLLFGYATYFSVLGALPQYLMNKFPSAAMQTFMGRILPVPLVTILSAMNVVAVRLQETEDGIEIKDKSGHVIGVSSQAGSKAVKETALSRAMLMGITAMIPVALHPLLSRSRFILRNSKALGPIKCVATALTFGAMIPVSFGLFPRQGTILRSELEVELQGNTTDSVLFYHRGL
uniref:Mitochondrial sideroflexin 4 n=2 Tax=Xenopus laevis TaxID=8355 RepID=D7RNZ9_XENLA|nr:mitochondrial sideroflexin 4 [Xenopus laevis]